MISFAEEARDRLDVLESHAERAAALEHQRAQAVADLNRASAAVGEARRRAAPRLAEAVEAHLRQLAMAEARLEVMVGDDPGDDVTFLLGANRGEPALPLARVASGGELSRAMLAARLVLGRRSSGPTWPTTTVFDEVDAGVGGQAALAVGRSLAMLASAGGVRDSSPNAGDSPGSGRQVLVVTHLPQVAAYADHQVAVHKCERGGRTVAEARMVDGEARVLELSRMLSGQPQSSAARGHAEELLAVAARERGRD